MNTAAIPARQLICLLQDTASGQTADLAAVELLARHKCFLHLSRSSAASPPPAIRS